MTTGRRTSDFVAVSNENERSGSDRRATDRRTPTRVVDPLFAATLVNQLRPAVNENRPPRAYQSPLGRPYCGKLLNLNT